MIEGRIPNPAGQNLSYYEEMMGMDFQMAPGFIESRFLQKWLPRMNPYQRKNMAMSMYDCFASMRKRRQDRGYVEKCLHQVTCAGSVISSSGSSICSGESPRTEDSVRGR